MDADHPQNRRLAILMPLKDDWKSASVLLSGIAAELNSLPWLCDAVIVDDSSNGCEQLEVSSEVRKAFNSIRVVRLARNVGHQRAIAIGIVYVHQNLKTDAVAVMDSDGEDTPQGLRILLDQFSDREALFAERKKRTESLLFKTGYKAYKSLHYVITGKNIKAGNFSLIPSDFLHNLCVTSELWNHYAASVFRSGIPFRLIPVDRGYRIAGASRMNFVALIIHGLSAMSVYSDVIGARLLVASFGCSVLTVIGIILVASIRIFTTLAIPGWATFSTGVLLVLLVQFITLALTFTFTILSSRINVTFLPLRDCPLFVSRTTMI